MAELITRYVRIIITFVGIWFLIYFWNATGCREVRGPEMDPTIPKESFKFLSHKAFKPNEHVGHDAVIFYSFQLPGQSQSDFAARVIGLPGDRIKIDKGDVYRDGTKLDRSYVSQTNLLTDTYEEIIVPRDSFFILMDNRRMGAPMDSRGIGPVGQFAIIGKFWR